MGKKKFPKGGQAGGNKGQPSDASQASSTTQQPPGPDDAQSRGTRGQQPQATGSGDGKGQQPSRSAGDGYHQKQPQTAGGGDRGQQPPRTGGGDYHERQQQQGKGAATQQMGQNVPTSSGPPPLMQQPAFPPTGPGGGQQSARRGKGRGGAAQHFSKLSLDDQPPPSRGGYEQQEPRYGQQADGRGRGDYQRQVRPPFQPPQQQQFPSPRQQQFPPPGQQQFPPPRQQQFPVPQQQFPPIQQQQFPPPQQQFPSQRLRGPTDQQPRSFSPVHEPTPPPSQPSPVSTPQPPELQQPQKGKQKAKGPKQKQQTKDQQEPTKASDVPHEGSKKNVQVKARQEVSPTDFIVPLRKQLNSGGKMGRPILIETNHLALILKNLKPAIHYDVAFEPDKPKKFLRPAMEEFRKKYYPKRYPAFDGVKNLYSSSLLPFGSEMAGNATINVDGQSKTYEIKVKFAAEVNLQCLADYFGSTARTNNHMVTPQEAIQCLDIVLRNAPALNCIPVGRSFFTRPEPRYMVDLGEGMEMYNGVYQSAVLGWKPFLNVDVSHKAFPKVMPVLDLIQELSDQHYRLTAPLVYNNFDTVNRFIKMLKVVYMIPNQPNSQRIMRVNELDKPAQDARFKTEDKVEMTVAEYFARKKNVPLKYPHLPCLWVGNRQKQPPILLPPEFCTILDGQVTNRQMTGNQTTAMIRSAATSTEVRKGKIMNSIHKANYNADPCAKEFGISVNTEFTKVKARVLTPPKIRYRKGMVGVQKGVWRADIFCQTKELERWSIVCLDERTKPHAVQEFGQMMVQQGKPLGMNILPPTIEPQIRLPRNKERETIQTMFGKLKTQQLILVVIPEFKDIYNFVKQAAEIHVGVMTQCVKSKNVFRPKPSTVGNILLKVNAKLNGLNHILGHTPACLTVPCMIMGADVTHPSPESRGSVPSVAAITASHDQFAFKYNITCRLQQSTQEIINDLDAIVLEHLQYFEKVNNGRKPERIIFFRDGVSEGQFEIVVRSEVQAVRRGCAMLDPSGKYKPKLTFLVVQKRHHTRFFPTNARDSEDRNCNVPAGTIVDTDITHPTALDFYLVSHASIQGVARPTKYRKLWDENEMQEDELEELTYHLCHLFARCTRSVSYPAPTYYAHLAAARAKVYCENQRIDMNNLERAQRSLLAIKTEIVKAAPMYFV